MIKRERIYAYERRRTLGPATDPLFTGAWYIAVSQNNVDQLKELLRTKNDDSVNAEVDVNGYTPLHIAIKKNNVTAVTFLLLANAHGPSIPGFLRFFQEKERRMQKAPLNTPNQTSKFSLLFEDVDLSPSSSCGSVSSPLLNETPLEEPNTSPLPPLF